ncbi:MAG: response regulator, partial [Polyangiaceae bacterium]
MNLLVVEDDEKIGSFVVRGLQQEGHHVDWAKNGHEGLAQARAGGHDVLVVDLMLPGRDGMDIIRSLRAEKVHTPILVLSAKSSVDDRVAGLQIGADDYLTKPFSFAELAARVLALGRRA